MSDANRVSKPWGKRQAFAASMVYGAVDVGVGMISEDAMLLMVPFSLAAAVIMLVLQVFATRRPIRWTAWVCLMATLLAVCVVNLGVILERAAGC